MPGFAESFWSSDYAGGLGVLFGKLQQGVIENQQVLSIARLRADAEDAYGTRLGDITPSVNRNTGGFARDDGASVRKAYDGICTEMDEAGRNHRRIAGNIRELVVRPFGRWCDAYATRIQSSQDDLQGRIKAHDRQADVVKKLRSQYFNKCRLVEDLEEENKFAFQDPQSENSPKRVDVPEVKLPEDNVSDDEEVFDIGDQTFEKSEVKRTLAHMLQSIPLRETKVPILGTYQNVSTGSDIVDYLQQHMDASSVSYAERIGQDLVLHGFLRLVGNVGNSFANSSKMFYQWRPKAFRDAEVPEKKKPLERTSTLSSLEMVDSPVIGQVGEYLAGWNPLNNAHPNETPGEKLRREAAEADERYKAGVRKLDLLRCNLEERMMDQLKYLERCELDRLKAIKSVILDFSGAISNVIPSLQSTVDKLMLYQETVQPLGDLRYLLENYRTGAFVPKVQVYENYYNSADDQIFGADLEARARADRKRVPIVVTTILTFLDNRYPDLEGDEARQGIWLVDVSLEASHHLRNAINSGHPISQELLARYEIPIVASVLRLYLLELPDSLVSSNLYEIIKTIYSTQASESDESTRISVIQNTLGQLRLANIATLDAITTHFTRLIELTSADEAYVSALANNLALCVLRPRTESSLTSHERHSYRLVRDLFAHKETIFGELKRASSQAHAAGQPGSSRPRAISTNEHNRRAHMEERAQAIVSRSRASSPQPATNRAHRRDRSTGGATTRFPIQTSPTSGAEKRGIRQSLEVPASHDALASSTTSSEPSAKDRASDSGQPNGSTTTGQHAASASDAISAPSDTTASGPHESPVEKRNSLGRVAAAAGTSGRFPRKVPPVSGGPGGGTSGFSRHTATNSSGGSGGGSLSGKRDSAGSLMGGGGDHEKEDPDRPRGVSLSDRPFDDD
ncbi:MAG: hypothetical protein M1817_001843 [Caeruleum heppii]|nr:MAG: hypothetical protein M1817_001843 [Caeruleum heppii]